MIHSARHCPSPSIQSGSSYSEHIPLQTRDCMQFVDITDSVARVIDRSGHRHGLVNIQTRHTTGAVLVNEHEPLLLKDLRETLERLAPRNIPYQHDDLSIRTENLVPNEPENGHAHCKALFLPPSVLLNLFEGCLQLGDWQRVFFLELDRPRNRMVSVQVIGQ